MTLDQLNLASDADAQAAFSQCCTAEQWIQRMTQGRPYSSHDRLHHGAQNAWHAMQESDFLQAFAGHPQIGDLDTLAAKYAHTHNLASDEQGGALAAAQRDILERLAQGNADYLEKFGFIFIVCASGKSAAEMLALLDARLPNAREQELHNAALEQGKILHLRLDKLLA